MARPATGSARWNPSSKTWEVRVSVNGKREPVAVDVPPCLVVPKAPPAKCPCASCAQAKRVAKLVSDDYRKRGMVPAGTAETANEWFARYLKVHGALGKHIEQHANDWRRFVADFIGTTPMTSITPDHVKAIRDSLTKRRLDGTMSSRRTLNIWSDQIKAPFSRAWSDDDPEYGSLRIGPFASNPALGIKPPSSKADHEEDARERQPLDPAEALALLSADAVPLAERRLYAVAIYTGLRPAELFGLFWSDVRLDEQVPIIKVQRARHPRTLKDRATKNRQSVRDMPIHPALRALLRAMRDEAGDPKGRVIPVVRSYEIMHAAVRVRENLLAVGIKRDELQHGTDQLKPFDMRSCRTTFATWASRAGYDSTWVSQWLGHKPQGTAATHYVKGMPAFEDAVLRPVTPGTVGPFPPLPESILGFGGVLVREPQMNTKGPSNLRFAWVLNLDADVELAAPQGYTAKRSVREAMASHVPLLARSLLGPGDLLVDEATAAGAASGFVGRAFCPTPRALAVLRRAGAEPEPSPPLDVLRRVGSRAFASALGPTMPGGAFVTDLEAARAKLATAPPLGSAWRMKRAYGMTGRGHRVVMAGELTAQDIAFLRAGMGEGGVQIEPNVVIDTEVALHGMVAQSGALRLGALVRQRCDARGAWLATERIEAPTPPIEAIAARLAEEATRVGIALSEAGYFGPFGVDAYTYVGEGGVVALQPRSEVNARYSMGFGIGFDGFDGFDGDAR